MSATKKIGSQSFEDFLPILQYIDENEDKLKILLSGDENLKPIIYPIKGKRATKTIFMSEKLQFLMTEYCIERELKIGDFVESAVIRYLAQNGYAEKLNPILNSPMSSSEHVGD